MLLASDDSGRTVDDNVTPPNCSHTDCSRAVMMPLPMSVDVRCDCVVGVSVGADDAVDDDDGSSLRCDKSGDCEREGGERDPERERDLERCWLRGGDFSTIYEIDITTECRMFC